jgi:DinB superfamily
VRRTAWFERRFAPIDDNGLLPGILERLDGTPARLTALLRMRSVTAAAPPGWSPAQELGHLLDLEPLWLARVRDIVQGRSDLTVADLTNRATHEGDHDRWPLEALVVRFTVARDMLVTALRALTPADLERSARHPRLGTPMRVVDLAYFVAEHDDHHMARLRELVTKRADHE